MMKITCNNILVKRWRQFEKTEIHKTTTQQQLQQNSGIILKNTPKPCSNNKNNILVKIWRESADPPLLQACPI